MSSEYTDREYQHLQDVTSEFNEIAKAVSDSQEVNTVHGLEFRDISDQDGVEFAEVFIEAHYDVSHGPEGLAAVLRSIADDIDRHANEARKADAGV